MGGGGEGVGEGDVQVRRLGATTECGAIYVDMVALKILMTAWLHILSLDHFLHS